MAEWLMIEGKSLICRKSVPFEIRSQLTFNATSDN